MSCRSDEVVYDAALCDICVNCPKLECKWGNCEYYERKAKALLPVRPRTRNEAPMKVYTLDGFTGTLYDWERRTGVPETVLRSRLAHGMSLADAINARRKGAITLEWRGERHTVHEMADIYGCSVGMMYGRLRRMSVDEAMRLPKRYEKG